MDTREQDQPAFRFEGTLGAPVTTIRNMNAYAQAFLPYNPTVVEVGASTGTGTAMLAETYRYGRVLACEADPRAFVELRDRLRPYAHATAAHVAIGPAGGTGVLSIPAGDRGAGTLLPLHQSPDPPGGIERVRVPVMTLDAWCQANGLTTLEFLRLDAGGVECQILQGARRILRTTLVVVTRTNMRRGTAATISFHLLKHYLDLQGFELLSHWYAVDAHGEATFVRRALYDSLFR